jgi:hypothetical protein
MNNKPQKISVTISQDSTVNVNEQGFVDQIQDLHTLLETLTGGDGVAINVKAITFHYVAESSLNFWIKPVAVQTAGAFADSINLAQREIGELIDAAVDDVFGYQELQGGGKWASPAPPAGTSGSQLYVSRFSVQIPGNLLHLLNKESETERLQTLYVGLVGLTEQNAQTITYNCVTEVRYSVARKPIVIR